MDAVKRGFADTKPEVDEAQPPRSRPRKRVESQSKMLLPFEANKPATEGAAKHVLLLSWGDPVTRSLP
jgi:hypothetical protein